MSAALIILCYLLLPVGFPFMPVLAGVLFAVKRARWQASGLWLKIVIVWFSALLISTQNIIASLQFLACLATLAIFALVNDAGLLRRISRTVFIIVAINILLILLFVANLTPADMEDTLWVFGDAGGQRYRFVFPEPNHMSFFIFFCALLSWHETRKQSWIFQSVMALGLLFSTVASGSPLAYIGLVAYAGLYLRLASLAGRISVAAPSLLVVVIIVIFAPENIAYRLDSIMQGTDNSVNLRTWGSFLIAQYTLDDAGTIIFGGGLGSARSLLYGNVYMGQFAAAHESVLPSFLGTMFIEGGYYSLVGLAIALVGSLYFSRDNLAATLASLLLVGHLLSSSYFYDTIAWAAVGLIYNSHWRRALQAQRSP